MSFVEECHDIGSDGRPIPEKKIVGIIPGTGWKAFHIWYDRDADTFVRETIPVIAWVMEDERGVSVDHKNNTIKGWHRSMHPIIAEAYGYAWDGGDHIGENNPSNGDTMLTFRDDEDAADVQQRCEHAAKDFEESWRRKQAKEKADQEAKKAAISKP